MRRRSTAGGKQVKTRRRKTTTPKRRNAPKAVRPRGSSAGGSETKVARLTNILNESPQQQTATADVLKVSVARRSIWREFLIRCSSWQLICARPIRESSSDPPEDASYYVAATFRHTHEFIESQKGQLFAPGRNSVVGRVLLESKSVQIPDVLADPEYALRETARLGGFRTILGVPLLREGIPIGVLLLQRAAVRPFTEKQIELVETFADQAVVAIENTRLFEAETAHARTHGVAGAANGHLRSSPSHRPLNVRPAIRARHSRQVGGPALRGGDGYY